MITASCGNTELLKMPKTVFLDIDKTIRQWDVSLCGQA